MSANGFTRKMAGICQASNAGVEIFRAPLLWNALG